MPEINSFPITTKVAVKADVGLGNVDNTSDASKPISAATQAALNLKRDTSATFTLADLGQSGAATGQVPKWNGSAWVPDTDATGGGGGGGAGVSTFAGRSGDVAPQTNDYSFAQIGTKPTTLSGYGISDAAPSSHIGTGGTAHANATTSVAGFMSAGDKIKIDGVATGATANSPDGTLLNRANHTGSQAIGTVTALQTALDEKAPIANPTFTGTVAGVTRAMVGLGSVDNTSDASKPVSTAQAASISTKNENVQFQNSATNLGASGTVNTVNATSGIQATRSGNIITLAAIPPGVDVVSGTTYTFVTADIGRIKRFTSATAVAITLPASLGVGFGCTVVRSGNGALNITGSSTTVNGTLNATVSIIDGRGAAISPTGTADAYDIVGATGDFTEDVQDVIGAMVTAAGGSYNDGAGTVTFPGGALDTEGVQDIVGAMVAAAGGTYNDAGNSITLPGSPSLTIEDVAGTTYTFVTGDLGKVKRFTNAAGCSATVGTGLGGGWNCLWERSAAAGSLTFVASSTTLVASNGSGSLVASVGRGGAILAEATDIYQITGQMGAGGAGDVTLVGTQTLTNKTLTAPTINGGTATALTNLAIRNEGTGAFDMRDRHNGTLTGTRDLTWNLNDANRSISLTGNLSLAGALTTSGAFASTFTMTASTSVTFPVSGTLASLSLAQNFTAAQATTRVVLTDAATVAIDASLSNTFRLLTTSGVGGTRALGAPTNPRNGQKISIYVKQDATGSRLLTYNAIFKHESGTAPVLSTGANAIDLLVYEYDTTDNIWVGGLAVKGAA